MAFPSIGYAPRGRVASVAPECQCSPDALGVRNSSAPNKLDFECLKPLVRQYVCGVRLRNVAACARGSRMFRKACSNRSAPDSGIIGRVRRGIARFRSPKTSGPPRALCRPGLDGVSVAELARAPDSHQSTTAWAPELRRAILSSYALTRNMTQPGSTSNAETQERCRANQCE